MSYQIISYHIISYQQQDGINNAEFYTKWTKTTWKTFEETKMMLKQDYQR